MTTLVSALFATTVLFAQERVPTRTRTLFQQPRDTITGGYVALSVAGTNIFGEDAIVIGGRMGLGVGHRIAFGLAAQGLANPMRNSFYDTYRVENGRPLYDDLALRFGYGGVFIEPVIGDHRLVHVSFPITLGAGGIAYGYRTNDGGRYTRTVRTDGQVFFFAEPSVEVELNILPALRLSVGAAYLITTDVDLPATDKDILRRAMLRVTLKTGQF